MIPARRRRGPAIPQASFLSDFLFFTKDLRVCLVVHELSGYCFGVPFATGEDPVRVAKAINAELSFAGVQGQHMVLRMDNERTKVRKLCGTARGRIARFRLYLCILIR